MFDLDASKLIIVGIVALIFIPPKDLPRVLRQAGQLVGKMRRMASEFQGQFMDAMREADMEDLRKEAKKLADSTKLHMGLADVDQHNRSIMQAIDRSGSPRSELPPPTAEPHAEATAHAEAAHAEPQAHAEQQAHAEPQAHEANAHAEEAPRPVTHPA